MPKSWLFDSPTETPNMKKKLQGFLRSPSIMDIIGRLPPEISHEILSYLSGPDLVKCSYVSKYWYDLVNYNPLWRSLCHEISETELSSYTDDTLCPSGLLAPYCKWRCIYREHMRLIRNWRLNRCKHFFVSKEDKNVCSSYSHNTLAIGYSTNEIEVFTVCPDAIYYLQSINDGYLKELPLIQCLVVSKDYLVWKCCSHIIFYKKNSLKFEFFYSLSHQNDELVLSTEIFTAPTNRLDWVSSSKKELLVINKGMLFCRMNEHEKIFIWDIPNKKVVREHFVDAMSVVKFYLNSLIIGNGTELSVLNSSGDICFKVLTKEPINNIYCNNNIIMVSRHIQWECYSFKTGREVYKNINIVGRFILDRSFDVMYFLLFTSSITVRYIEATQMYNEHILWKTMLKEDVVLDLNSSTVILNHFLLLFHFAVSGSSKYMCTILGTKNGDVLYTIPDCRDISFYNDSLIVSGKHSICVRLYKY